MLEAIEKSAEIRAIYDKARREMGKIWQELDTIERRKAQIRTDNALTARGKQQREEQLRAESAELRKKLETQRETALRAIQAACDEAAKMGDTTRYGIRAKDLDADTVRLYESGILSDAELLARARSERTAAMQRFAGGQLLRRAESCANVAIADELRAVGYALQGAGTIVRDTFAAVVPVVDAALRTERLYADGAAPIAESALDRLAAAADDLDSQQFDT